MRCVERFANHLKSLGRPAGDGLWILHSEEAGGGTRPIYSITNLTPDQSLACVHPKTAF